MTPKEKAKELVLKMVDTYNVTSDFCYNSTAKACSIIAVDEIIQSNPLFPSDVDYVDWDNTEAALNYYYETKEEQALDYWQQVKKEIEKL